MPIRDLTDDEQARLLTQEQVDSLPDGAEIYVKWSGGNGPAKYEISSKPSEFGIKRVHRNELTFIGKNRCHNRVFR